MSRKTTAADFVPTLALAVTVAAVPAVTVNPIGRSTALLIVKHGILCVKGVDCESNYCPQIQGQRKHEKHGTLRRHKASLRAGGRFQVLARLISWYLSVTVKAGLRPASINIKVCAAHIVSSAVIFLGCNT
ncbi:hypothetical protein K437DRAFT_257508 [Tilletiaria anomala UBC 951]|uniref:Secreted protein n=1 Tax=Tilletiaria anomala (strain ATCC 24038 / CBS 436.72 / UBC 951) TaxID=1037660 RepID=A0A066VXQ3_TILAU|nr:uncharacterized protein K437DRAFT_257508 [Tilletiaria anomala UBC 951]KDN43305.1 hypothetical protein K437DRAFT_257508 [Tilletiaria anomala UBC 951]